MKRCVLHIGMHKTGSSSIQASLQNFSSRDFRYAHLLRTPNHSGAICLAFSKRPQIYTDEKSSRSQTKLGRRIRAKLTNQLERSNSSTLIISGEGISKLRLEELETLYTFISKYVSEVEVVCYVRSTKSYIESALQQRIKSGLSSFDPATFYPHYRSRFEKFDLVFGREKVRFWEFKPQTLKGGCVVTDFCARLGVDLAPEKIIRKNDSLSAEALSLLYTYQKYRSESSEPININTKSYDALLQSLSQLKGKKLKLSPKIINPLLLRYKEDMDWMAERLGSTITPPEASLAAPMVESESDLLRPSRAALSWLIAQTAPNDSHSVNEEFADENISRTVSQYMHKLVERTAYAVPAISS